MTNSLGVLALGIGLSLFSGVRPDCYQTAKLGLRTYRVTAVHGRFRVDRNQLSIALTKFKETNFPDGEDEFIVSRSLPRAIYNEARFSELVIADANIEEISFDKASGSNITNDHRSLLVGLPFQSGARHGIIILAEVTDSTSPLTSPMVGNRGIRIQVDSVDVTWDPRQTVTYRSGDDVFSYIAEYDALCDKENQAGKDINDVVGNPMLSMPYKGYFDWGCDDQQNSFCQYLTEHRQAIDEAKSNVCVAQVISDSRGCPAKMEIIEMTGEFRDIAPYLADNLPTMSFESEFLERGDSAGIVFPCIC